MGETKYTSEKGAEEEERLQQTRMMLETYPMGLVRSNLSSDSSPRMLSVGVFASRKEAVD